MRTIPHRELRNNSSAVLADVKAGETIAVTNNGEISAILVPPSTSAYDQMVAAGLVSRARRPGHARDIARIVPSRTSQDVLDELRSDR
ncbi:type II toxin-antitoxin system Phd/YefM family antitoxin [Aeromicrobium fastidiosum]|nr:type II toxin-antitoxin system prevent-host-death family antitoxin [Aeromicrobium fastidiosum]MBP2389817.1 prevent-host-death family protein [Aeromicrobium fastidiosum]